MVKKSYCTKLGFIDLYRPYYYDRKNKSGVYFIEEKYPFLKDICFPEIKELICFLSSLEVFETTKKILQKTTNINISTSEIQKVAKEIGSQLVSIEDQKIKKPMEYIVPKKKMNKMVISMDGAMVNTIKEGWKEVKSGVIYELKDKKGDVVKHNCSYVSRIENCNSFRKRIYEEARRRHYLDVNHLIVIGDGAKWIWELAEKDYLNSIQIIDWYHAKQHLFKIIKLLYDNQHQDKKVKEFTEKLFDLLYDGNIASINKIVHNKILELNIYDNPDELADIHTELKYFERNKKRMQYRDFKSNGFPIGSGVIEATCKQLVQIRLKRNGMKWSQSGAHAILQLRCLKLGNRWNEVQNVILKKSA